MGLVKQIQGQLKVEDGAVAPRGQVAAELAEEQLVRSRARWRGDISRHLSAAVNPVMNVVAQVRSEIAAVLQDVQRDARKRKEGGDFLQTKRPPVVIPKSFYSTWALMRYLGNHIRRGVFVGLAKGQINATNSPDAVSSDSCRAMGYGTVNSVTMTKAPALLTRSTLSHISSPLLPSFIPIVARYG